MKQFDIFGNEKENDENVFQAILQNGSFNIFPYTLRKVNAKNLRKKRKITK